MSVPGSPSLSRPATRPGSPSPGAISKSNVSRSSAGRAGNDPLRAFPTHLSQRIFGFLDIPDLAKCAQVCKKWCSSQSINYGKLFSSSSRFCRRQSDSVVSKISQGEFPWRKSPPWKVVPARVETKLGMPGTLQFSLDALTPLPRESYISSWFRRENRLAQGTQLLTLVLATSHQGRWRKNSGAARLWRYHGRVKATCGRCTKS